MSQRPPTLLTVQEFASVMRVDPRTVRRWQAAGDLRLVRVGGVVRIATSEIDRLTTARRSED